MGAKLSDSGADWDRYQEGLSSQENPDRIVSVESAACLRCGQGIVRTITADGWVSYDSAVVSSLDGLRHQQCPRKAVVTPEEALKALKDLVNSHPVTMPSIPWPLDDMPTADEIKKRIEDWRTADTPEAAAERAKFEKEQGE